jgi:hypothetical protein
MQNHTLQQQIVDLTTKVRQLEINIMDTKATTDRKCQSLQDEIPNRLQRELRQFEQKEIQLHKEYQSNMNQL